MEFEAKEIAKRINRSDKVAAKLDGLLEDSPRAEQAAEVAAEKTTLSILAELMESLKNGETLEEAIQTIHANF